MQRLGIPRPQPPRPQTPTPLPHPPTQTPSNSPPPDLNPPSPNPPDPTPPRPQPITVVWRIFHIGTVANVCPTLTLKFSVTFVAWRIFFVANLPWRIFHLANLWQPFCSHIIFDYASLYGVKAYCYRRGSQLWKNCMHQKHFRKCLVGECILLILPPGSALGTHLFRDIIIIGKESAIAFSAIDKFVAFFLI